jgi:hypothetical protein
LTQPPSPDVDGDNYSLIDASYVKFLEGGGAVVVPIFFNQSAEETQAQFSTLSGVLFTGGPAKPTDFTRYYRRRSGRRRRRIVIVIIIMNHVTLLANA